MSDDQGNDEALSSAVSAPIGSTPTAQGSSSAPPITTYAFNWVVEQRKKNIDTVPESAYERIAVEHTESAIELRKTLEVAQGKDNSVGKVLAVESETMRIYSPYLLRIIPEVIGYYPSYSIRGHKDPSRGPVPYLEIAKPYRAISGVRDKLTPIKESLHAKLGEHNTIEAQEAHLTLSHIEALEHELDKLAGPIDEEKRLHQLVPAMATFDMLWLLFRPGTQVITKVSGQWAEVKVYLPTWGGEERNSKSYLELITWYHDFDGTHLRRRRHTVKIHRFDERQEIKSLSAYPVAYAEESLLDELLARGKTYYSILREPTPQSDYNGMMITMADEASRTQRGKSALESILGKSTDGLIGSAKKPYKGIVIADPFFFATEFGAPNDIVWLEDLDIRVGSQEEADLRKTVRIDPRTVESLPSDSNYRMMPRWIRGFAVNSRLWAMFDAALLKTYEPNSKMIESLVMNETRLGMIKAIAKPRLARENFQNAPLWHTFNVEQVNGKGEGRVILLHGAPGTGKTFTAECIAEWTGRPLLRMTCGELGLNPTHIEAKLWQWFRMAEAWQAVLLIDEADVYVAKRLPNSPGTSLERETIVAVFLRALEYYKGILFLTTNAVLGVDPAITTRATLIVHLKLPNEEERSRICTQMEKRVARVLDYDFREGARDELNKLIEGDSHRWNYREIVNVYQVAIALAERDEEDRSKEHNQSRRPKLDISGANLRDAKSVVLDFMGYQQEALKSTEQENARNEGRY